MRLLLIEFFPRTLHLCFGAATAQALGAFRRFDELCAPGTGSDGCCRSWRGPATKSGS